MSTGTIRALRWAAALYVALIRGIPVLLIIFFVYFGIPLMAPGSSLSEFWAAVIALSVFASAYIGELVRGSIQSVPRGQFEAADALGLSYAQRMRWVILPQAARMIVPPGVGFLVVLIKDSSLVAVIGLIELTRAGNVVSSLTADPITTYLIVGAGYFIICYTLSSLGRRYERTARRPRQGARCRRHPHPHYRSEQMIEVDGLRLSFGDDRSTARRFVPGSRA